MSAPDLLRRIPAVFAGGTDEELAVALQLVYRLSIHHNERAGKAPTSSPAQEFLCEFPGHYSTTPTARN
jgi:hypothetical protein